jgi:Flp pilus assembly protein TadG
VNILFWRKQKGAVAVEFGILALPMAILLVGIVDIGRAMYSYDTIAKSARDAARFLTSKNAGDINSINQAKCLAVYGNTGCTGSALASGLTTAMVDVCDAIDDSLCPGQQHDSVCACSAPGCGGTCTGVVNLVSVRITAYPFASLYDFAGVPNFTFGSAAGANNPATGISVTMRQDL